jgi:hypothetical protein
MAHCSLKSFPLLFILCQLAFSQSAVKRFEIPNLNSFKILVATDLHCDNQNANDLLTFSNLSKIVGNYRPDLLIVLGDLITDYRPDGLPWVADHIAALKVPWAFARGNHDNPDTPNNFGSCHAYLTKSAYSLHAGTVRYPHYRIGICNKGDSVPIWNLFIIDDAWPTMGFQQAQIDWFNGEAARIGSNPPPAFAFFHIPLPQHLDVWNNGPLWGVKLDGVDYHAGARAAFTAFVNSRMIRGIWCGHDHRNNYFGLLSNIIVAFAQSSGISGYGTAEIKKGATLITVNAAAKTFSTKSVYADDPVAAGPAGRVQPAQPEFGARFAGNNLHVRSPQPVEQFSLFDCRGSIVFSRSRMPQSSPDIFLPVPGGMYVAVFKAPGRATTLTVVKQK